MILITWGLLTLLAFSNAGGDHIKGGGHIKGGDHIKGGSAFSAGIKSVPQALIQQEEAAPAVITKTSVPASVKTAPVEALTKKGEAPYGLKTAQHEVFGKIHRTAELQQAAIQPVAQVPVIQAADGSDPGRVKGLKTVSASVPAVGKTSSIPAAAGTQSIKGIKTVAAATRGKTRFSVSDSQFREPLAKPIVDQTVVTATKTSPSIIPQKTIKSAIQPGTILTQQKISQATTKGGSDVLPEAMQVNLAGIGEVRKVVIPTTLIRNQEINADIKLLNRQLMEKQTEEELKKTLAGIVNADSDMGAITFSEAELNDLSMRVGANAIRPQARPDLQAPQQRRPDEFPGSRTGFVRQRIPAALKPQIISGSAEERSGFDQRIRYTGTRITTSGVQGSRRRIIPGQVIGGTSDIQGENMKFVLGNTAVNIQPGSPTVAAPKPRVSAQEIPKPQTPAPARRRPQAPALVQPQPGLSTDIVELNRQLMQKQNEEEIKRTFEGIVRTDSNLGAISLSEAELADISRRVGSNALNAAVPTPQQRRPEQLPKPVVSVAPQRRPAAPEAQQRRPAVVGQGILVAPKPQIIAGGAGVRSGFDQRIRYTGTRVTTSGVQGSGRRIIPGQVIGGTSAIQGENMQFFLGNTAGNIQPGSPTVAAPKPRVSAQEIPKPQTPAPARRRPQAPAPVQPQPGLSMDIVELNRQLMQKQNEEEIKRTFEGIVGTDSNLGAISLSEAELADISRRVGSSAPNAAIPTPQQRRPEQLPKPVAPQRRPAAPGAQQRRPAALGQGIPVAPKPQIIAGGAGVRSGFDQRIRYTGTRVTTSRVQGSGRRISPGQVIGGTSAIQGENTQFVLGNTAGNIQPGSPTVAAPKPRVSAQAIPKPQTPAPARRRPQAPAPVQPQPGLSTDIVELNRQLMQKQSEEEIKRTFEGIVRTDSNLGAISLSEAELADISRRVGSSAPNRAIPTPQQRRPEQLPKPVAPQRRPVAPGAQQRRPAALGQGIPVAPKPQIIAGGAGVRSGFDQRIRYTGTRVTTSGVQGSGRQIIPGQVIGGTSAIQGENMQFVLGNTAGNIQPGSPTVAAPKPRVSAQEIPKPQTPAPARRRPQAPAPVQPQPGLSTDIVELNRQLMQKQNEEEIKRTFEGIVRTDSNLGAISLSEAELADISRRVGSNAPNAAVATPQQRRPEQLPKPVAPQRRPAAPGAQQRRPAAVGQRIPVAPKPQIIGGSVGEVSGFNQRVRYTGARVRTSGVQGPGRRIIPGQVIGETSDIQGENMQFVLGNAAGNIQPGSPTVAAPTRRVSAQATPKPQITAPDLGRPQTSAPVLPQSGLSTDIVELNRQLMQKQNEEELRQALSGVIKADTDFNKISLSSVELSEISRSLTGQVSGPSSSESVIPVPYLGGAIEGQRIPSSSSRDASFQRYGSGVRGSKLTGSRTYSQSALNAASKKQIMTQVQQKVGQESIESPLELQQKIESTLAVAQVEEPVVQSKVTQTVKAFNSPISQSVQKVLDTRDSSQLQMKFDDIIEQSQLSKPAVIEQMQLPSRKSKMALDNLSQKYLQEKLPVEIPSYVPHPSFMSPFNYRVPHLRSPIMQQQERLDQILM
ncbi:unnamed protein product [Larinioides sclopetarius]|uniref:Uncharacterized protein n=1 Tax=Larinioides sclopetarius TaxID=280406 RepID=A0AAV2B1W0_9ARAC